MAREFCQNLCVKGEHNPLPPLQSCFATVVDFSSPRLEFKISIIPPIEGHMSLK